MPVFPPLVLLDEAIPATHIPPMIASSPPLPLPRVGIDISKLTFDVHLCTPSGRTHSAQFANSKEGFALLDTWLSEHCATKTRAGLEATGPYGVMLLWHLHTGGHQRRAIEHPRIHHAFHADPVGFVLISFENLNFHRKR